jgi:RNA polymerase sigma factor (sigma-70 family)
MHVRANDEAEYREFVVARLRQLRRAAYLLCRDWHTADDLVAISMDKLYRRWPRRADIGNLDAYVRVILARAWVDTQRKPWRREWLADDPDAELVPGVPGGLSLGAHRAPTESALVDRVDLAERVAALGPRRRAVIVLRYYCDLSVEETAGVLGISPGTVKSQTARALDTLRASVSHDRYATQEC